MEAVPAPAQGNSSGANTSSVKSDDSSPRQEGRGSPPPNCAICLGTCRNKSFTDSCLHQFCFKCLLTWSRVKAVCPLCKQNFRSIIHNVRSNHQYEEYMVEQPENEEDFSERIDIDSLANATRQRFRYRTTFTLPRHESIAFQQLLLQHYPMMANVFPGPARRRRLPFAFRRTVYRHNLWARPLPDFTGRFRDCSPEFYRYNDSQIHRLVPWLNRELHYLLNENFGHISYVLSRILELLPQYNINSSEFRDTMRRYLGERTDQFLHELYCFASTPYDMTGYDRNVQYTTNRLSSGMINEINEIISSSDSDTSVDSDIIMITSSESAEPPAGPSRVPPPIFPQNYIPDRPANNNNNVIPIETISQSDSDDDDEVMVVGYIKPPQDRTPEVVDLLGSDSDVMVQEIIMPEPSQSTESRPGPLVKLSLKRNGPAENGESDSEDLSYIPVPPRRRRRDRSSDSTTTDTCRSTPSPAGLRETEMRSTSSTSVYSPSKYSSSTDTYLSDTLSDSSDTSDDKNKAPKSKRKRKSSLERNKKKIKKRSSHPHYKEKRNSQNSSKKTSKCKSYSGKDVKSSKKSSDAHSIPHPNLEQSQNYLDQPTTSGTSNYKRNRRDRSPERKRLKSVVSVVKSTRNEPSSSGNTNLTINTGPGTSRSNSADNKLSENSSKVAAKTRSPDSAKTVNNHSSDSEDDIPLNLSVQKNPQH